MKTIITTVGTSIFTNYQKKRDDLNDKIKDLELKSYGNWDDWKDDIEIIRKTIDEWLNNNDASAEIKSILKLKEGYSDVSVYLIATDTILSALAAEIVGEYLKQKNIEVLFDKSKDIIKELQVKDRNKFVKVGLSNLIKRLKSLMGESYEDMIFNITGGYKALIPFMTLMGQIYNIPICYIFEETDELIELPQAPVDFDFSVIEENYIAFQSLGKNQLPSSEEFERNFGTDVFNKLKNENLVEEIDEDEKVNLTPLGIMLVKRYEELFNSGKYHKQNLISNLIELKLFEYFVKKYWNEASVEHGKKIGKENYDIDIYIENEDTITAIEVKPGGNVPIWKDTARKESIEYKLTEGGFKHLIDNHNEKKLKLEVFLYRPKSIHQSVIEQMGELCKKYSQETKSLKYFWLKIPDNYLTSTHWDITKDKIKELKAENQKEVKDV
jgi:putative CRISPR-associated protein (TIGR02619 family)